MIVPVIVYFDKNIIYYINMFGFKIISWLKYQLMKFRISSQIFLKIEALKYMKKSKSRNMLNIIYMKKLMYLQNIDYK